MKNKIIPVVTAFLVLSWSLAASASPEEVIARWRKSLKVNEEDNIGYVEITASYYAAEYVQALVQKEAEANLWTRDEEENYKYELLKTLQLEQYIPVLIEFDNQGPSLRMAPFGDQVSLWIGKKEYSPVDYDKRFNFKLAGKRSGLVYFPRYDEKTGRSLLEGIKSVRLTLNSSISPITMARYNIDFIWDVHKDNPEQFFTGKAAERLELDRLITRLGNLRSQREEIQKSLDSVDAELALIQARIDELQGIK